MIDLVWNGSFHDPIQVKDRVSALLKLINKKLLSAVFISWAE
jgi:hypothetical protein